MDSNSVTDNVWINAGHAQPVDGTATRTSSPHHLPDQTSLGPNEQTVQNNTTAYDGQRVCKKSNLGLEFCKAHQIITVKAWRARYALLVILGYAAWLILALFLVDAAAVGVRGVFMPSYRRMIHQIDSRKSERLRLMYKQNIVENIRLEKRPFETHPECLIRATNIAHEYYGKLPYQSFPDIAQYTTEWAQTECNRILFSPVQIPQNGWQYIWRALTDYAGAALHCYKGIVGRLINVTSRRSQKSSSHRGRATLSLPPGFDMECNNAASFCHLSIEKSSDSTTHKSEVDKLLDKERRVRQIIEATRWAQALGNTARPLIPWMNLLGLTFIMIALHAIMLIDDVPLRTASWRLIGSFVVFLLSEFVFMSMYFWYLTLAQKDHLSRTITSATYILHLGVVLLCFANLTIAWLNRSYFYCDLLWALRELRNTYFEPSEGSVQKLIIEYSVPSARKENGIATEETFRDVIGDQAAMMEGDAAHGISETSSNTSVSSALQISPSSPFHEDVQLMRKYLHRKQTARHFETPARRLHGATLAEPFNDVSSPGRNSDSEWAVIASTENRNAMHPGLDNSNDDGEIIGDLIRPTSMDEETSGNIAGAYDDEM